MSSYWRQRTAVPTSTIFVDESGKGESCFVVAAVKFRNPGIFGRAVQQVRDRHQFSGEFKFGKPDHEHLAAVHDLVDALAASDAQVAAYVVDFEVHNPFIHGEPAWLVQAGMTSGLLARLIGHRELAGVCIDRVSTPGAVSFEERVREDTNSRLRRTGIVSALTFSAKGSDLLQAADMVAGSIFHERKREQRLKWTGCARHSESSDFKDDVAGKLAAAFGRPGFLAGADSRLDVATYRGEPMCRHSRWGRRLTA